MPIDVPPVLPPLDEPVVCSIMAAVKYELPVNIVLAVAAQEGGKPGQWVRNTNGTYDVGPMQFNTSYLRELSRYGITPQDVEQGGCYAYELAAWRLRGHVRNDRGDLWTRVANYHSRTPTINARYRQQVMRRAAWWADWLDERFATQQVAQGAVFSGAPSETPASAVETTTVAKATAEPRAVTTQPAATSAYVPRGLVMGGR
ncbi:transglycosylase SLT domain-containing protein [Pseudomonas sp. S60]|uniref:transglycosylase SLT domain-containing protein n=1 Tax=Pseudomonas sp. S60 TaxID=211124 RepID=UPI001914BF66|nr:transglycosylase SLT domain-containing protein [Pseudomonas sp. S60]MBK5010198.1 transglycosylase SLT domain-containing protein [Pseudomonas sp. S60]